ncbi:malto-oligosyltrehalose synthase [Pelagibacterium montanilacus]|uniref:malto-oligosyltrehalose synthase n=1 Tax=Pelagibacterium montanilacus TaxID=2185280 RepID=UPI000F8CBF92|nr:malto-oligosyltrehalose synthase [Pelagibacterium montanilacus]
MIPRIPTATYRIQLREGMGFAEVEGHLDYFKGLGISHLYLSPIFQAAKGSTHGYDVTDPTEIDPTIGGRAGFEALARAARARDIGIILDIVPNHTAFTLDNPWLRDVLMHGEASAFAPHFDIDWKAGPLVLPFLPEPFEKMIGEGRFAIDGDQWVFDDVRVPMAPGTEGGDLRAAHEAQHWRLVHWELERDGITHRRFFNVTSLVGMRVEDPKVFEDTHALIFDLVREGLVHGLRVDHIDGLVDPSQYLGRLAEALPDTPVWIEKIVVGSEEVPEHWATAGTTGYEAARMIARLLTVKEGLERLDDYWSETTGISEDFAASLVRAKRDILDNELAAERLQLVGLAAVAAGGSTIAEAGPESLREAVTALLLGMRRYRTYFTREDRPSDDRELVSQIVEDAAPNLRSSRTLELLRQMIVDPGTDEAHAFVVRFQQVSGALLAKAQEDTAGFRWTRFIAANEVGAEPEEADVAAEEAQRFLDRRSATEMTLTSTHDTKRSEDSRMRLVAISHLPEMFIALYDAAAELPDAGRVEARWRWYIVQSALALFSDAVDEIGDRLDGHIEKAMREAKLTSFWTRPDTQAESNARAFAREVLQSWTQDRPEALAALIERGNALSLAQLALKAVMPGFPDFYRGSEISFLALTDPDNRLPVDWGRMQRAHEGDGFDATKARWTRELLAMRAAEPEFFSTATAVLKRSEDRIRLVRQLDGTVLAVEISHGPRSADPAPILSIAFDGDVAVSLYRS